MKITYIELQQLPKMAWGAIIEKETFDVIVYHGRNVETQKEFFVEGAWEGNFAEGRFDQANFFNGSGGRMKQKKILFVTSNHTLDRLHSVRLKDKLVVSNSMPFALHLSEAKLDIGYIDYEKDLNSILKGLSRYTTWIPLEEDKKLYLYYYCNLVVDKDLSINKEKKTAMVPFKDYTHYRTLLSQTLKQFVQNAKDPLRRVPYGIVTTISNGYDSSASAVIAKEAGCDKAITFDRPANYKKDCGLEIAKQLGYSSIIVKDASTYLSNEQMKETEFVSTGELGSGIVYTSFEKEMSDNIVIFGENGDEFWGKDRSDANADFCFEDNVMSGISLIENRLRVGYIFTPVPTFGGTQWESLYKISNSLEMQAYSIGGTYDRPIPRRVVETAGIPREAFGKKKIGAGINYRYDNFSRLRKKMSKKAFASYQRYYKMHRTFNKKYLQRWAHYLWDSRNAYLDAVTIRLGIKLDLTNPNVESATNPGAPAYLIHWGVHEIQKRYHAVFEKEQIKPLSPLSLANLNSAASVSEDNQSYLEKLTGGTVKSVENEYS